MKKNRARLVVVVSLLAVPVVYLTVRWATPIVQWIGFGVRTELRNHAVFDLAGVVVHEDGSPFGKVAVSISAGRKKKMGFETDYKTWRQDSDGTFDIKVDNANYPNMQSGTEVILT